MKLFCPIPYEYLYEPHVCVINQMFGANANKELPGGVKYGPKGHGGLDLKTIGVYKWYRFDQVLSEGKWKSGRWKRELRGKFEANGRIPILASMEGTWEQKLNFDKKKDGWGSFIVSDEIVEDGVSVQYRLMYWHLDYIAHDLGAYEQKEESFWRSLATFLIGKYKRVKPNVRIAYCGENGMANGPHLHFELQRRFKGKIWGSWEPLNPLPYLTGNTDIIYQTSTTKEYAQFYYMGKEITREERDNLLNSWPKYE